MEKLADFPDVCREAPEAEEREDVKELIFQGYRVIYLREENHVYIVTVIHKRQDFSAEDLP